MGNKIKNRRCHYHDNDSDISEYVFWSTDIRKKNHIDIYECKKCKEHLEKAIDRENRIRTHNKNQEEIAYKKMVEKSNKYLKKRNESIKNDMWDFFIKDELAKGVKLKGSLRYKYKDSIPKELLQLTRATMKLKRLIELKKKLKIEEDNKKIELEEKLKKPLMNCAKHGTLFIQDCIKAGKSRWTDIQRYKCRKCMSESHRDHYIRKKDNVLEKCALYRKNNPNKIKEMRKAYKIKLIEKSKEFLNGKL